MKRSSVIKLFLGCLVSLTLTGAPVCAAQHPAVGSQMPQTAPHGAMTPAKPKVPGVKTIFDLSHSEIFSPVKKGPLHYSDFYESLKKSGETVGVNNSKITAKTLEGVKTYIIAGPSKDLGRDEIEALRGFVNSGGNLLVLLHISSPVARLTEPFGIIVSNFVIAEKTDTIKNQSQDFYVTRFNPHPITNGLKKIAVFGSWGLMAEGPAKVLASTSDKAWADMNRNRSFDKDEPVQSFGVLAAAGLGNGKIVVVADDAPFANQFIGEAENRQLAENIMKWFK